MGSPIDDPVFGDGHLHVLVHEEQTIAGDPEALSVIGPLLQPSQQNAVRIVDLESVVLGPAPLAARPLAAPIGGVLLTEQRPRPEPAPAVDLDPG